MVYNPYYFDLTEPVVVACVNHDQQELTHVFNAWAAVQPVRAGGERYIYQAEQRVLRGCYRVWLEQAHPLESTYLIKWKGRWFEIVSEPVQDTITPWQYFMMEEVTHDLSDYIET